MSHFPRRDFLAATAAGLAAGAGASAQDRPAGQAGPGGPKAISSANGLAAVTRAVERMKAGADTLDAAMDGVGIVEDDPKDNTVGLGGVPNEEGVVQLDSACMHGPTARGGAVASLENIRNPSKVARLVAFRTDHVLLVGPGALKFAKAHGFAEENLLTDEAREIWLEWKSNLSAEDDWLPANRGDAKKVAAVPGSRRERPTGTIHLSAIDGKGNLSGVTTTSGLWFKIPGRVGDSPILGAGIYTDNAVGSAGSTGRGEANLLSCASFLIVEFMRQGQTPEQACLGACQRIADLTRDPRLKRDDGKPDFDVKFYALDKHGRHGSAAIYKGAQYALHDGDQARLLDAAYLYDR